MDRTVSTTLSDLANQIGTVEALDFQVDLAGGHKCTADDFDLSVQTLVDGTVVFAGACDGVAIEWAFAPWQEGYWVSLHAKNASGQPIPSMSSLILTYCPNADDILDWRVPTMRGHLYVGMIKLRDLPPGAMSGAMIRGAFADSKQPGLFLGTAIPQSCLHSYAIEVIGKKVLRFTGTTEFTEGISKAQTLKTEKTWICAHQTISGAMDAYATHIPPLDPIPELAVGWNSWDYYYSSVSLDDMIENLDEIERHPALKARVKYIVVDMGWYHTEGEWYANYRFPGSIERLALEIEHRGFVPGIWTAPIGVNKMSKTAWRCGDLLVKDAYGDPDGTSEWFMLDPTHPQGQAFLREMYTRLYRAGFRFFKVDYVSVLLGAKRFHDPTKGPYDVLRDLFAIIRECVHDSHILGCSLPEECGPGIADSGRIGIDIHNQWTHIEWAVDNFQLKYWQHNRIWASDPDFLIVRGSDTSLEEETNVMNPTANNPNPPRWRRGPVFTLDEARTWATLVQLSGGSVFLSDRLSMLNDAGKALIYPLMQPTGVAARPLDLGDGARPSLWLAQGAESTLGVINWSDAPQTRIIDFSALGLETPTTVRDFWNDETLDVDNGQVRLHLTPHASALLCWTGHKRSKE